MALLMINMVCGKYTRSVTFGNLSQSSSLYRHASSSFSTSDFAGGAGHVLR